MNRLDITEGFSKYACFNRANSLLDKNKNSLLSYVCLELRFCIEAIAYQKLNAYKSILPSSVMSKWQPPQAMKALLQLEPEALEDFTLYVGREDTPGKPAANMRSLGTHSTFRFSWLRKTYNKLGNYLHVPNPSVEVRYADPKRQEKLRSDLKEMIRELEPIVQSHLDGRMGMTVSFDCCKCGKRISISSRALADQIEVECMDRSCSAVHWAKDEGNGEYSFGLKRHRFKCLQCSQNMDVEERLISIGFHFNCSNCGEEYEVCDQQWECRMTNQITSPPPKPTADS